MVGGSNPAISGERKSTIAPQDGKIMAMAEEAPSGADVRALMRRTDRASLATLMGDGSPYASLVLLALDHDASPLLLLSNLAEHSRNIARDSRVSLLIDGTAGLDDPLTGSRASLTGSVAIVDEPRLLARFTNRHPSSAGYAGFGDFHLYRMQVSRAHLVAGFGRIRWIEGSEVLLAGDHSALAGAEPSIIAHMNNDHAEGVNRIAARARESGPREGWAMTGIDPEGADFRSGGTIARAPFRAQIRDAGAARSELVHLARAGGTTPAGGA
jgi:heme oxygenase (biliverdin-IX-beta and delta-forming)